MLGANVRDNLEAIAASTQMAVEGMRAELEAGLAQFQSGLRIDGDRYVPASRQMLTNGRARIVGWSLRAGAADVAATLHNGTDASGDVVAVLDLKAGTSSTTTLGRAGVACPAGVYLNVATGSLTGAVHLGAVD